MSPARLTSEVIEAEFVAMADERRRDRRAQDRRAARAKFDTLFAATLVNQVTPREATHTGGYGAEPTMRPGVVVNVSA